MAINVYQTDKTLTSSMDVDVVLTNLTARSFDIKKITVILPNAVVGLRPDLPGQIVSETYTLPPGSQRVHAMRVGPAELTLFESLINLQTLLFVPGEYVTRVQVEFSEPSPTATPQQGYATQAVALTAPLSSMLRGGALGALLLALFVPAYRRLRSDSQTKVAMARQSGLFLLAGSITSITAILLLQRLGELELPITIEVKDYLGGMVVGLFSYKVGDNLYGLLFEAESKTAV